MTSIKSALQSAAGQLQKISEEYKLEAEILLMFTLEKPRSYLHAWPEKILTQKQLENFLRASTEELKNFARLTGNNDVHQLSKEDLCTTNSEISNNTDVEHV